ncbi:hypothetical protein NPIL_188371 [Nephila pilipes]|uniref:Uncharacterized protein n=1 Tax=Nephila pilipes TaxID=299642 RepID=A0A8X6U5E2_NEPPI|nr:hypothetical protein NPIL_188371 [Nephila pilipes]
MVYVALLPAAVGAAVWAARRRNAATCRCALQRLCAIQPYTPPVLLACWCVRYFFLISPAAVDHMRHLVMSSASALRFLRQPPVMLMRYSAATVYFSTSGIAISPAAGVCSVVRRFVYAVSLHSSIPFAYGDTSYLCVISRRSIRTGSMTQWHTAYSAAYAGRALGNADMATVACRYDACCYAKSPWHRVCMDAGVSTQPHAMVANAMLALLLASLAAPAV